MILRAVPLGDPGSALPAGVCTPGELERARALLDPARRHAFLAGRLALRALVAEAIGVDPARLRPEYTCPECGTGEHGTPGFTLQHDGAPPGSAAGGGGPGGADDGAQPGSAADGSGRQRVDVAASMSRAGGWALLAVEMGAWTAEMGAWTAEMGASGLGVDLAVVADFHGAIPDAAYSPDERRRLSTAQDPAAEAARLWARKEALLKALGRGLRDDPAAVDTLGDPRVADLDAASLGLPPGYAAAVAQVTPHR